MWTGPVDHIFVFVLACGNVGEGADNLWQCTRTVPLETCTALALGEHTSPSAPRQRRPLCYDGSSKTASSRAYWWSGWCPSCTPATRKRRLYREGLYSPLRRSIPRQPRPP